eukprot:63543-Amphidinium_carterae.1
MTRPQAPAVTSTWQTRGAHSEPNQEAVASRGFQGHNMNAMLSQFRSFHHCSAFSILSPCDPVWDRRTFLLAGCCSSPHKFQTNS